MLFRSSSKVWARAILLTASVIDWRSANCLAVPLHGVAKLPSGAQAAAARSKYALERRMFSGDRLPGFPPGYVIGMVDQLGALHHVYDHQEGWSLLNGHRIVPPQHGRNVVYNNRPTMIDKQVVIWPRGFPEQRFHWDWAVNRWMPYHGPSTPNSYFAERFAHMQHQERSSPLPRTVSELMRAYGREGESSSRPSEASTQPAQRLDQESDAGPQAPPRQRQYPANRYSSGRPPRYERGGS
ncbi:hypothetical protein CBOM_06598 [Ceraceosorus bombacis]|uniref:Uncharacterized protein n=1 Tax=Ceraceosorus bombacis TaxID=401625 RepID=A0A0P1BKU8_9BASI|nr:hypothetical protein CBOM_06598 [Ceraceosorus bombacis]